MVIARKHGAWAVMCCTALALTFGCGSVSPQRIAARAIRNRLPELIGPAKRYDVSVDADPFALTRGDAREIDIHGVDVQATPNLTLDDLQIDARNIHYDRKAHKITRADSTTVTAAIGAQNLTRYLQSRHTVWSGLVIEFDGDHATATLPVSILQETSDVKVTGHCMPDASDPSGIDLVADSASVAGVPLPASVVNLAARRYNPIVDLGKFQYPVRITQTQISGGRLMVSGTVDIVQ